MKTNDIFGICHDIFCAIGTTYSKDKLYEYNTLFGSSDPATLAETEQFIDSMDIAFQDNLRCFFYNNNQSQNSIAFENLEFGDYTFSDNFSIDSVVQKIRNIDLMKKYIISYYFNVSTDNINLDEYTVSKVNQLLTSFNYPADISYSILNYFINPQAVSECFIKTIYKVEKKVRDYRDMHKAEIAETFESLKISENFDILNNAHPSFPVELDMEDITVSISYVNRYTVYEHYDENKKKITFILLGCDYLKTCDYYIKNSLGEVTLKALGACFSDPSRLKLVDYILENDIAFTQEMQKHFGWPMSSLLYHLDILFTNGMLLKRNKGRQIYYSINNDFLIKGSNKLISLIKLKSDNQE